MAAITEISQTSVASHLRPLNPRRDLRRVADLIELCFDETLDADGRRYLSHMRRTEQNQSQHWWEIPLFQAEIGTAGFVWEEKGQIVGNISLIPFVSLGKPIYLIANVAVHPDYRRRGIARALTNAALERSQKRRVRTVWLQVRDNNPAAVQLYESVGFIERACRTTWTLLPGKLQGEVISGVRITSQKSGHWKPQREWLRQNYPDPLLWYWPVSVPAFRPGIWGMLARFVTETHLRQWAVERQGQLLGTMSWRATSTYADQLWLAAPPEHEDLVLKTLLPHLRWRERDQRPLSIDYPVGRAANTLLETGFRANHTLIWMEINL